MPEEKILKSEIRWPEWCKAKALALCLKELGSRQQDRGLIYWRAFRFTSFISRTLCMWGNLWSEPYVKSFYQSKPRLKSHSITWHYI
jgi:hypothetical protein